MATDEKYVVEDRELPGDESGGEPRAANPFDGDDELHKAPNSNIRGRSGLIADVVTGEELKRERAELELLAENEQISVKEGMRSGAQKRAASRLDSESIPPPRSVSGAYGTAETPHKRQKRNQRGKAS